MLNLQQTIPEFIIPANTSVRKFESSLAEGCWISVGFMVSFTMSNSVNNETLCWNPITTYQAKLCKKN